MVDAAGGGLVFSRLTVSCRGAVAVAVAACAWVVCVTMLFLLLMLRRLVK